MKRLPRGLARLGLGRGRHRRLRRARRAAADRGPEPRRAGRDRPLRAHDRHRLVDPRRAADRRLRDRRRRARLHDRLPRDPLERRTPRRRRRLGRAVRGDAPLCDAARLRVDRRPVLRALGRREHRPRGDDAHRRVLRRLGLGRDRRVAARARHRRARRRADGAPARVLLDLPARGPDRRRHGDQLPRARSHELPVLQALRRPGNAHGPLDDSRRQARLPRRHPGDRHSSTTSSASST